MGVMQWQCLMVPSWIAIHVLEDRFGYDIEVKDMFEWGVAWTTLKNGDIDVLASEINYVTQDHWLKSRKTLEKISPIYTGLFQGLAVPSYVPINSIEELNEHKDKFNGEIIGIEPGAGLMRQTREVIEKYDLKLKLTPGSTAAMLASLDSAIKKEKWIVFTLWTPQWANLEYDIKYLEDPKGVQEPSQTGYMVAYGDFEGRHPLAAEVIQSIFLQPHHMNEMMGMIKNEDLSVEEATKLWIEEHKDKIDRWANIGGVRSE